MNETKRMSPIKALILSDNHITRSGLRGILESHASFQVLGEGSVRSTNIVESLVRQDPAVIIVDLDSNGVEALNFIRHCKKLARSSVIVVLCDLGQDEVTRKALAFGAAGVALKLQPPSALIAVLLSLVGLIGHNLQGSTSDVESVVGETLGVLPKPPQHTDKMNTLTAREREITRLIAAGLKNKEIAERLHISDITVRHHLTSIFNKLEVLDRQKLLIVAHEHGLVELSPASMR